MELNQVPLNGLGDVTHYQADGSRLKETATLSASNNSFTVVPGTAA
jgi:hypothetical protein